MAAPEADDPLSESEREELARLRCAVAEPRAEQGEQQPASSVAVLALSSVLVRYTRSEALAREEAL